MRTEYAADVAPAASLATLGYTSEKPRTAPMHWLYLLLALGCFALSMRPALPTWAVLGLIAVALGLMVAWMLGWMAARLSGVARNDVQMISPAELRRMRELAAARKPAPPASNEGES